MKHKFLKIYLLFTPLVLFGLPGFFLARAAEECEGVGLDGGALGDVCLGTITPFRGITEGGLIAALATLFNYVFMILILVWIIMLMYVVFNFIRSNGNQDMVQESSQAFGYMWKGTSIVLIGLIGMVGLSNLVGFGSPFTWPDDYYQCASENEERPREIYINAKERVYEELIGKVQENAPIEFYCCSNTLAWQPIYPGIDSFTEGVVKNWEDKGICKSFKTEKYHEPE